MTIFTENFRKYESLVYLSYDKTSRLRSHLYLNFEDKEAIICGLKLNCRFPIEHDDTEMENFYVSIPEFLALCQAFDELEIEKKTENNKLVFYFSSGDEAFKLGTFIDKEPDMSADDLKDDDTEKFDISDSDIENFKNSIIFMGDESEGLAGIQVKDNIFSSDGSRLYEAKMSFQSEKEFDLDKELIQLITTVPSDNISFYITPSENIVLDCEDVLCVSSTMNNLDINSNFNDPDFIATYDHEDFIILDKDSLNEILNFFTPFVQNEKNERLMIEVESKDQISIQVKGMNIGVRHLPIEDSKGIENLIGSSIWVSRPMLSDAISVINDENICIQIGDDDARAYNVVGSNNKDVHVSNVILV